MKGQCDGENSGITDATLRRVGRGLLLVMSGRFYADPPVLAEIRVGLPLAVGPLHVPPSGRFQRWMVHDRLCAEAGVA